MLRVRELLMTDFSHLSTARSRLPSCLVDGGGNDKVASHSLAAARGAIVVCSHDLIFKQGRQEPALRLLCLFICDLFVTSVGMISNPLKYSFITGILRIASDRYEAPEVSYQNKSNTGRLHVDVTICHHI